MAAFFLVLAIAIGAAIYMMCKSSGSGPSKGSAPIMKVQNTMHSAPACADGSLAKGAVCSGSETEEQIHLTGQKCFAGGDINIEPWMYSQVCGDGAIEQKLDASNYISVSKISTLGRGQQAQPGTGPASYTEKVGSQFARPDSEKHTS